MNEIFTFVGIYIGTIIISLILYKIDSNGKQKSKRNNWNL